MTQLLTKPEVCATFEINLTDCEYQLIRELRSIKWGYLEILVQNEQPVSYTVKTQVQLKTS